MCLRDYGHGNTLYIMLLCGNGTALIRVMAMLLFLCSVTVQAQHVSLDSIYHINEIVIDGHKEVSAHQVIGYEQIQALPSSSVADALKYMAGVQIKDYGGLGGQKTINVRSLGSQHVGVYLDGVRITNAQNGTVDLGKYSLTTLESVSLFYAI